VHPRQVRKHLPNEPHGQECKRRKPSELNPDDHRQGDEVLGTSASRASRQQPRFVSGGKAPEECFGVPLALADRTITVTVTVITLRASGLDSPGRAQFLKSRNRYIAHRRCSSPQSVTVDPGYV
jgi:hypothetical protein